MPGGIHPPVEVILTWPWPNYDNPVRRPKVATILACVLGPLTMFLLLARLWVRIYIQRNTGLDDWLMLMAIVPIMALTVLIPLATDVYFFNTHVWDVQPHFYVVERKYVMAIESIFCVASGLIKVSILLFYKRLGSRAVSKTFLWVTRLTITFITAYSIAFTLVPIFGCQPISAFWDQVDPVKTGNGYTYKCFDEGADVFSAAVISSAQDLLTAVLPTFLYWNLQIPIRQKIVLFGIFAVGYGVVAIGALRSYYSWQIFYETYDVTWVAWFTWIWTFLEIHMGAFCANAPALKVFFKQVLQIKTSSAVSKSGGSNNSGSKRSANKPTSASLSTSTYSKMTIWKSDQQYRKYGHITEPYADSVDSRDGVQAHQECQIEQTSVSNRSSADIISGKFHDIELGEFQTQSESKTDFRMPSVSHSQENLQALPRMPSPYPAAYIVPSAGPNTSPHQQDMAFKPSWKTWS